MTFPWKLLHNRAGDSGDTSGCWEGGWPQGARGSPRFFAIPAPAPHSFGCPQFIAFPITDVFLWVLGAVLANYQIWQERGGLWNSQHCSQVGQKHVWPGHRTCDQPLCQGGGPYTCGLWCSFQVPDPLTCLLKNRYAGQEGTVRTGHGTDWIKSGKGVRQVGVLSPCLFNLYAECIMRNAGLEEAQAGVKTAGRSINNLRYANDTFLVKKVKKN